MSEESSSCGLGEPLSQAQKGGFFLWFCLSAVGGEGPPPAAAMDPKGRWQRFRPSGPRFHDLVELTVGLDESECIGAANLAIARSFIARAAIRPFARDIAKSFLYWVLPEDAAAALQEEIALIGSFADGESVVIGHPMVLRRHWFRRFTGRHDEAAVFMGQGKRSKRRVGHTCVAFENCGETPESWLFMRVSRSA